MPFDLSRQKISHSHRPIYSWYSVTTKSFSFNQFPQGLEGPMYYKGDRLPKSMHNCTNRPRSIRDSRLRTIRLTKSLVHKLTRGMHQMRHHNELWAHPPRAYSTTIKDKGSPMKRGIVTLCNLILGPLGPTLT